MSRPDPVLGSEAFCRAVEESFERKPFRPHRWLPGGHLQTVAASQMRRTFTRGRRRIEQIDVDASGDWRVRCEVAKTSPQNPTLFLIHGMGGSSESKYMQAFSHKASRHEWNSVLLNLYNLNVERKAPKIFHAGCSREVAFIVREVRKQLGFSDCLVAGVSMGGNILLKMLGEWETRPPDFIKAAAVLSPLVDLTESWRLLDRRANWLYRRHYLRRLKRLVAHHCDRLAEFVDPARLRKVRTIRQYDEIVTAPLSGFDNAMDYYRQVSSAQFLDRITVPTLIIHSKDDPLLPWKPLARPVVAQNPRLFLHLSTHGGHVGFIQQEPEPYSDRCWAEDRLLDFLHVSCPLT